MTAANILDHDIGEWSTEKLYLSKKDWMEIDEREHLVSLVYEDLPDLDGLIGCVNLDDFLGIEPGQALCLSCTLTKYYRGDGDDQQWLWHIEWCFVERAAVMWNEFFKLNGKRRAARLYHDVYDVRDFDKWIVDPSVELQL